MVFEMQSIYLDACYNTVISYGTSIFLKTENHMYALNSISVCMCRVSFYFIKCIVKQNLTLSLFGSYKISVVWMSNTNKYSWFLMYWYPVHLFFYKQYFVYAYAWCCCCIEIRVTQHFILCATAILRKKINFNDILYATIRCFELTC